MTRKDARKRDAKPERIEYDATISAEETALHLESLARGLREGRVVVGDQTYSFEASVDGAIGLEMRARRRRRKVRIDLRLKFRPQEAHAAGSDGDGATTADDPAELVASAPDARASATGEMPSVIPDEIAF